MKILYASSLWSGVRPLITEGATKASGMPAFLKPAMELSARGHELVFLFLTKKGTEEINVKVPWLADHRVVLAPKPKSPRRSLPPLIEQTLGSERPDFVYLQGFSASSLASWCKAQGVPCGQRLYGVHGMAAEMNAFTKWRIRWRKPHVWAALTLPKNFLLITQDGTHADQLLNCTSPNPPFTFHHVFNGCDSPAEAGKFDTAAALADRPFLFHPGRFAEMKQNHLAVRFLATLHKSGFPNLRLVFAGQVTHENVWRATQEEIEKHGLQEHCEFLGTIPHDEVCSLMRKAIGCLSFAQFSNLSNICLEALANGSFLVSLDDGSLDTLLRSDTGLLANNVDEAARRFAELLAQPAEMDAMRLRSVEHLRRHIPPWSERAAWECDLIEETVRKVQQR